MREHLKEFHRRAADIHDHQGDSELADLHRDCLSKLEGGSFGQSPGAVPSSHSGPKSTVPDDVAKALADSLR